MGWDAILSAAKSRGIAGETIKASPEYFNIRQIEDILAANREGLGLHAAQLRALGLTSAPAAPAASAAGP